MATSTSSKGDSDGPRGGSRSKSTSHEPRSATVALPFVTMTFRMPEWGSARLPNREEVTSAASSARPYLPSPQQAVYYGGLAALAAFELIEWPVALAIGAGAALIQHTSVTTSSGETPASAGGSRSTGSPATT